MLLARHGRILCRDRHFISQPQSFQSISFLHSHATKQDTAAMSSSTEEPSYEQRVIGSVLGAMCGDALGASVEGWTPERMSSAFPDGLRTFQETERG